jgi:hypothetical protein
VGNGTGTVVAECTQFPYKIFPAMELVSPQRGRRQSFIDTQIKVEAKATARTKVVVVKKKKKEEALRSAVEDSQSVSGLPLVAWGWSEVFRVCGWTNLRLPERLLQ